MGLSLNWRNTKFFAVKIQAAKYHGAARFWKGEAQLNTAGLTFLDLDFLNRSATVLRCVDCGHLEWFC